MHDAWDVLLRTFPQDWRKLARDTGALNGLRKGWKVDCLLRTLLLHFGCGYSFQHTADKARWADLADLSGVAVRNRAKKSKGWLHALCVGLFEELGLTVMPGSASQVRAVDATTVKAPGRGGSWRLHYSLSLSPLACDFRRTRVKGPGTDKSLVQFPISVGDFLLAGRGYSTAPGIRQLADAEGHLMVPLYTVSLLLRSATGQPFDLRAAVTSVKGPGTVGSWAIKVVVGNGPAAEVAGRLCVLRRSAEAHAGDTPEKVRRAADRKGNQEQRIAPPFPEHVVVFTTYPERLCSTVDVLEWYRLQRQVELVFDHFGALAELGHGPRSDEDSVIAWFYGTLVVALLLEKLIRAIPGSDYDVSVPRSERRDFVLALVQNAIKPPLFRGSKYRRLYYDPPRSRLESLVSRLERTHHPTAS